MAAKSNSNHINSHGNENDNNYNNNDNENTNNNNNNNGGRSIDISSSNEFSQFSDIMRSMEQKRATIQSKSISALNQITSLASNSHNNGDNNGNNNENNNDNNNDNDMATIYSTQSTQVSSILGLRPNT